MLWRSGLTYEVARTRNTRVIVKFLSQQGRVVPLKYTVFTTALQGAIRSMLNIHTGEEERRGDSTK